MRAAGKCVASTAKKNHRRTRGQAAAAEKLRPGPTRGGIRLETAKHGAGNQAPERPPGTERTAARRSRAAADLASSAGQVFVHVKRVEILIDQPRLADHSTRLTDHRLSTGVVESAVAGSDFLAAGTPGRISHVNPSWVVLVVVASVHGFSSSKWPAVLRRPLLLLILVGKHDGYYRVRRVSGAADCLERDPLGTRVVVSDKQFIKNLTAVRPLLDGKTKHHQDVPQPASLVLPCDAFRHSHVLRPHGRG